MPFTSNGVPVTVQRPSAYTSGNSATRALNTPSSALLRRIGAPFVGMAANGVMYVLPADVVFTA